MSALDQYLDFRPDLLDLDLGPRVSDDTILALIEGPTEPKVWAQFALSVIREVWMALPPEIQDTVREQMTAIIDAVGALVGAVEMAPIIGDLIAIAIDILVKLGEIGSMRKEFDDTHSRHEKNYQQIDTLSQFSNDPTQWLVGLYRDLNYPYYEHDASNRENNMRWRARPCISPSWRDSAVWGLGHAPKPDGNCFPGRALDRKGSALAKGGAPGSDGRWRSKNFEWPPGSGGKYHGFHYRDGSTCVSQCAVSSLFYPFWSTNHRATPIAVGTDDESLIDELDPNPVLIQRQTELLINPLVNLRAHGSVLRRAHDAFVRYFKDTLLYNGLWRVDENGDINGAGRHAIDPKFDEDHSAGEHAPGAPKFYWGPGGTIVAYGKRLEETPGDEARYGVPALAPENPGSTSQRIGLAYTVGSFNAVVRATRGFFLARRNFLLSQKQIRAIFDWEKAVHPNRGRGKTFDPEVQKAMIAAASGSRPRSRRFRP